MGTASEEFFKLREQQKVLTPAAVSAPVQPTQTQIPEPQPEGGTFLRQREDVSKFNFISEEEQTKRYGGVVGSLEYYDYRAKYYNKITSPSGGMGIGFGVGAAPFNVAPLILEGPMGDSIKRQIDSETWDRMSRADQAKVIAKGSIETAGHMIASLPVEIAKVPFSVYYTAKQMAKNIAKGDPVLQAETEANLITIKGVGSEEMPSWFKTYDDAVKSGYGPLGATMATIGKAGGDIAILGSMVGALRTGLAPRKVPTGETAPLKTQPIKAKLAAETKPVTSVKEYYSVPQTTAKTFGGNSSNTFLKLTNAGENMIEVSVVKTVGGKIPAATQYIKSIFGETSKVYQGAHGPEIKIQSQVVKVKPTTVEEATGVRVIKKPVPEDIQATTGEIFMEFETSEAGRRVVSEAGKWRGIESSFPDWVQPKELRSKNLFDSITKKISENNFKFTKNEKRLFELMRNEVAERTGRIATDIHPEHFWGEFETQIIKKRARSQLKQIPDEPIMGFETKPIKPDELDNINLLAKVQGINPDLVPTISKVITGKNVIGDLTHAEYVKLAQTIGSMSETPAILQNIPQSWFGKTFQRTGDHAAWMEKENGIPLYKEFWNPLDESFRLAKSESFKWIYRKNEIFGEYNALKFKRERGLVDEYIKGNTEAITKNEAITPKVKADLIRIAEAQRNLYEEAGKFYKVSRERFGELYTPAFKELGGVHQVYISEIAEFPTKGLATPRHFRHGSVNAVMTDASVKFDNYIKALSQEKYVNPVLARSENLYKAVDPATQKWMKDQTAIRLGAATEFERFLNNFGTKINKYSGLNLPPDILRKVYDDMMLTSYSGALGLPRFDAPIRDFITTNMILYGRLGAGRSFALSFKDALKKAASPEWANYMRQKSWLVEYGVPGGEELALAKTGMSRARATYRSGVESTMSLYQMGDNKVRGMVASIVEDQFDNALARYKAGKITWDQAEKEMLLDKFHKPSQNIVRERVNAGDITGARDHMVTATIDEISFPYRMGAGAPITFGAEGRTLFHLSTWNLYFAGTLTKWARTGQWGNFMRFIAAGTATKRSMEEAFGIDVSKFTILARIADPTLSPILQLGTNIVQGLQSWKDQNSSLLNENTQAIIRTWRALGVPGGVGIDRWRNFWKSVNNYEKVQKLPDVKPGMFPVFDRTGRQVIRYSDFADLVWMAFGFMPADYAEEKRFVTLTSGEKFKYQEQGREKVIELIKESLFEKNEAEKKQLMDEATQIIQEFGITGDLGKSVGNDYKPLIMRIYNQLNPSLKARFQDWYKELLGKQLKI